MNNKNGAELSKCQQGMRPAVDELRAALQVAEGWSDTEPSMAERDSVEADICLGTRSAYFDFYTWVVVNSAIDDFAEQELAELFDRAIKAMKEGKFKSSVEKRYKEFEKRCQQVRNGNLESYVSTVE